MALVPQERLTPGLLRLMEHEKAIEQGLAEVGWNLREIRDQDLYVEVGFSTFEDYCRQRWDYGRNYVNKQIRAAETIREIEDALGTKVPTPDSERQVRPLTSLPTTDDRIDAWQDAVEAAEAEGRDRPTAKHVEAAVAKRQPPKREHPAPFSDPILEQMARRVEGAGIVLDPFAGTGRVHELRERAGVASTIGVEIEPEWAAKHPDTIEGNALDLPLDDESVDAIATSPTYGNRMADHHTATDNSVRLTYKHTLGRDLHADNSGAMQWGDEYRTFHRQAWAEAVRTLRPGGRFVLNIKDHIRDGEQQQVSAWHADVLAHEFGLRIRGINVVPTRGLMAGENADKRTCAELILTFEKPL